MLPIKTRVLATASVLPLLLGANVARAQETATPASSGLPTAAAQPQPDEIVVTGVRQSLQTADNIKRFAPSNVNAIVAEDLGKFTDNSIADALQRVPGVEIQRDNRAQGPGTLLSIRGLGADFVLSTINGREYFGNPAFGNYRSVDYDSIPPEVLAGVVVYKTPTASLIEPGLAGEVDLRTLRPLDQKTKDGHDIFAVVTAEGQFETVATSVQPKISGVIGGKFFDGTLGVYVSGIYNKERLRTQNYYLYTGGNPFTVTLQNADGTAKTYNNLAVPLGFSNAVETRENLREGISAGLEWKPDDHWHLMVDFEFNRLTREVVRDGGDGYLGYQLGYLLQNNLTIRPGGATLRGTDIVKIDTTQVINNPKGTTQIAVARNRYRDQSLTGGINLTYHSSRLDAALDFAHSESKYVTSGVGFSNYEGQLPTDYIVDLSSTVPKIQFTTPQNYKDINAFLSQGLTSFPGSGNNGGSRDQGRLDFAFKVVDAITLKAGVRYASSSYISRGVGGFIDQLRTTANIQKGFVQQAFFPTVLPSLDYDALIKAFPQAQQFIDDAAPVLTGGLPVDFNAAKAKYGFGGGSLLKETTTALYAEVDGKTTMGSWNVSGNAGVRAVNVFDMGTTYQGTQFRLGASGQPTPGTTDIIALTTTTNQYWRYLPSVNLLVQPRRDVNIRLSYNKSLSLAPSGNLIPTGTATINSADALNVALPNTFNGSGNTKLKPTSSDNFDATVEFYPGHIALVASGFYKNIHDLIAVVQSSGPVPGQPDNLIFSSSNVRNAFSGSAYGFELSANVPFTFLHGPLDGFGIEANYTYVEGKSRFFAPPEPENALPGSSRHNVNVTGYYEKYGFSARASYTYRSTYLLGVRQFDHADIVRTAASIDASVSQEITPNLSVIVGGTNLNRSKEQHFLGSGGLTSQILNRPLTVTFGIRAKL